MSKNVVTLKTGSPHSRSLKVVLQHHPRSVRRRPSLGPSTQRARVCLYVTLINNTVVVVSFPSFVQFILHTAATVYSYVTEMAPGQKRHTSQARFSYAAEPRALLCTG